MGKVEKRGRVAKGERVVKGGRVGRRLERRGKAGRVGMKVVGWEGSGSAKLQMKTKRKIWVNIL